MPAFDIATLAGVGFFTAALTTITGTGGGVILLATMLQFLAPAAAIPVHGAVQLVTNAWRLWLLRGGLSWPLIIRFGLPMPFGIALGLWLFQGLSKETVQIAIGGFILFTLFTRGLRALRDWELPLSGFIPLGFVVGTLNVIVGVVNPILGVFMIRKDLDREGVVGTMSFFAFLGHTLKVAGFSLVGFSFVIYGPLIAAMIPAVLAGTYVGRQLLGRFSERLFQTLLKVTLTLLALKLILWDGLGHLL